MKEQQICPRCFGNGYIKVYKDIKEEKEIVLHCTMCGSQGEIPKLDDGPLNKLREGGL